jgi:lysophospholipase L1-like esterase
MMRAKNKNKLSRDILSGIAVTLLFFVCAEVVLRFSPWEKSLGPYRFYGGMESLSMFWDPDSIVRIPSDELRLAGEFRGKNITEHKPSDTYRIICMGGSFTYGWPYNNMPSAAYPARLEQLLNESTEYGNRFEVINAGIGGYSSCQGLFYFRNRLYKLDPDLVVVCFGANDSNNNHEIGVFYSDKEYYERLSRLYENKILSGIKRSMDHFRIYALAEKVIFNIKKIFIKSKKRVPPGDFRGNLQEFISLAKTRGFRLLFVPEPHINLLDLKQEIRINPYYNIMYTLAEENPEYVRVVDSISLAKKYRDKDIFYDEMHLLPSGHTALAELIVKVFRESGFDADPEKRGER